MSKKYLEQNVYDASKDRINLIFESFNKIYLSFSGGKDSSVMFHLVADAARKRNKMFSVLIIDLEAQYKDTILHIEEMLEEYKDVINVYWVALPLS